jgi:hypothetical protein
VKVSSQTSARNRRIISVFVVVFEVFDAAENFKTILTASPDHYVIISFEKVIHVLVYLAAWKVLKILDQLEITFFEFEGVWLVDLEVVEAVVFEGGEDEVRFSTVGGHSFSL